MSSSQATWGTSGQGVSRKKPQEAGKVATTLCLGLLLCFSAATAGADTIIDNLTGGTSAHASCIGTVWTPHEWNVIFPVANRGQTITSPVLYYRTYSPDSTTMVNGAFTAGDNGSFLLTPVTASHVNGFTPPGTTQTDSYYIFDFTGQTLSIPTNGILWFRFDALTGHCSQGRRDIGALGTYTTTYQQANNVRPGGTSFLITSGACGDMIVEPGEECDDGNTASGDGCSSTCQIEPCWVCAGSPSVCELGVSHRTLDSLGNVGKYTSMDIGTDGKPIIAYYDATTQVVKVAHCSDSACTSATSVVLEAVGDLGTEATNVSLRIGSDGLPLIAYRYNVGNVQDLRVAHCSTTDCSSATKTTVYSSGNVGLDNGLTIGADGLGLISNWDVSAGVMGALHCNSLTCTAVTFGSIGPVGAPSGRYSAITTVGDGKGLAAYSGNSGQLRISKCVDAPCINAAQTQEISGQYAATSITTGTDGNGLIVTYDYGADQLRAYHCGNTACASISNVTLASTGGDETQFNTDVVIDGTGKPRIAYRDGSAGNLKLITCGDATCSASSTQLIAGVGDTGRWPSIAMSGGRPIISYYNQASGDLEVATCGSVCGDGNKTPDEACDDGNTTNGDGCGASCTVETCWECSGDPSVCAPELSGSSCSDDGLYCTGIESCDGAGACVGSGDPCSGGGECNTTCNEGTDDCFDPNGTPCSDEPNICTVDACNGLGACAHVPGNTGALCRTTAGDCDVTEHCDGINPSCPPDVFDPPGWLCGDPTDDACTDPDTCDGNNNCLANHAGSGSACPNDGNPCTVDQCDGSGSCLHPAGNAGTQCRADTGQCDVAETCDGSTPSCPADGFEPSGTGCNDGSVCTQTDECDGSGACTGSNSLACDDGNACTANDCDPTDGCENPPALATGCKSAAKAILILKQNGGAGDKQLFKWVNGDILTLADLADPTTSTEYGICMFEGPSNELLESISVPPGAPNWRAAGSIGYKYKELTGSNSGITKMLFRGNDTAGKSKALVKGKGDNLPDPTLGDMQTPVTVQVINPDTGACVEAVFDSGDVKKNTSTLFKAKAQ